MGQQLGFVKEFFVALITLNVLLHLGFSMYSVLVVIEPGITCAHHRTFIARIFAIFVIIFYVLFQCILSGEPFITPLAFVANRCMQFSIERCKTFFHRTTLFSLQNVCASKVLGTKFTVPLFASYSSKNGSWPTVCHACNSKKGGRKTKSSKFCSHPYPMTSLF